MLRKLLKQLSNWLFGKDKYKVGDDKSQPKVKYGDKVGNVLIEHQYQLDKHTDFKPGESYRVGEAIATVHANKASMLKAIAAVDAKRIAKEAAMREHGIDIMLMSPEELEQFNLNEWLGKRKELGFKLEAKVGASIDSDNRYIPPTDSVPKGNKKERFKELVKHVKEKDKVG